MSRELTIETNRGDLTGEPIGFCLPEITHAANELKPANIAEDFVSPDGREASTYCDDADEIAKTLFAEFASTL